MPRIAPARPRPARLDVISVGTAFRTGSFPCARRSVRTTFRREPVSVRASGGGGRGPSGPVRARIGPSREGNGRQIVAEQLYATLKTSQGDIDIRLLPNHA